MTLAVTVHPIPHVSPPPRRVTLDLLEHEAAFVRDVLGKCTGSASWEIFSVLADADEEHNFRRAWNIDTLPIIILGHHETKTSDYEALTNGS